MRPETEVTAVRPRPGGGYTVETKPGGERFVAEKVIFAGGVMGTVPLLLKMREDPEGLPRLSPAVGRFVRTNSEALIGVVSPEVDDFHQGIAITSILHTDAHSHIEPVRYGSGSGFFRTLALPESPGPNALGRIAGAVRGLARHPLRWARALTVRDFSTSQPGPPLHAHPRRRRSPSSSARARGRAFAAAWCRSSTTPTARPRRSCRKRRISREASPPR